MDPLQQPMPQGQPQVPQGPMTALPNLMKPMSTADSKNQGRLITSANQPRGKKAIIKNRIKHLKK